MGASIDFESMFHIVGAIAVIGFRYTVCHQGVGELSTLDEMAMEKPFILDLSASNVVPESSYNGSIHRS